MAHVVNPIYDTVFKYIMQDEKVAKVLIGNILKTKVVSIQMNNNEYAAMLPDGKKVFKLDFSATILDKAGKQQLVHIEVQKALEEGEIMRFRHYLGAIYMDATKKYQETISNPKTNEQITVEHPLPIHTIYILGHTLGDGLSESVMHGENIFKDQDGNIIQIPENNDYINGLTHTVTFVIAPLTKKNVKTHLDRLLSIFSDCEPNKEEIEIDEYFDDSDDYRTLMKALQKASVDKQLRGNLELEQYEWAKQTKLMRRNIELQGMVDAKEKQLLQKDAQLSQKDAQLSQKDAQLSQKDAQLSQQQAQLSAAIKALSATNSAEQIAQILNVSKQQVEMILKQ
ncbi:MAG: hypothetical protein IIT56_06085 [Bacteroidales bacterium]|nr:hypothetical protein [Bacteroidales bacterium]